jgi:hypothetical protein
VTTILDVSLTDVQAFLTRAVKTSPDFETLCLSTIGTTLNFSRGADLERDVEEVPYFTSYKFNFQHDEGQDSGWRVQFVIGIDGRTVPELDSDGVIVYNSTDNVEKLAIGALRIIESDLMAGGLKGICDLRISSMNMLITEVGEADDVQAIVTLLLESYSTF